VLQEEGGKGYDARQSGDGQHNKKRGMKDTIQGDWAMAVVGRGDTAGGKCNNQIESTTAVVRTVGMAIDGREARAKDKMSDWRTMQGNRAVVGTVGAAIDGGEARPKGKMSGWRTMQGNPAVEDATRGMGGQREAIGWWMTQREERGRLQGPNAAAEDTTREGLDNARHVACNDLPPYMIDIIR
jgi:hypothetical protein